MNAFLRRVVASLVVLLVLVGPLAGRAGAVPAFDPQTAMSQVDAYWSAVFAANGVPYHSPRINPIQDATPSACGTLDPWTFGPAVYCPADETIYVSLPEYARNPDLGHWYSVVSHEWGHHIQNLLGVTPAAVIDSEQLSDCLAGAFVGTAVRSGVVSSAAFNGALPSLWWASDPPFLPEDPMMSHDIAGHRMSTFTQGYVSGVSACGIGLS